MEKRVGMRRMLSPETTGASPACQCGGTDAVRGADALAEGRVDLAEGGPLRPLLLPAVQHQLMEVLRAVNRSRQPETVLDGLDHLQERGKKKKKNRLENLEAVFGIF